MKYETFLCIANDAGIIYRVIVGPLIRVRLILDPPSFTVVKLLCKRDCVMINHRPKNHGLCLGLFWYPIITVRSLVWRLKCLWNIHASLCILRCMVSLYQMTDIIPGSFKIRIRDLFNTQNLVASSSSIPSLCNIKFLTYHFHLFWRIS